MLFLQSKRSFRDNFHEQLQLLSSMILNIELHCSDTRLLEIVVKLFRIPLAFSPLSCFLYVSLSLISTLEVQEDVIAKQEVSRARA